MTPSKRMFLGAALAVALALPHATPGQAQTQAEGEVNVYSYRQPFLIQPLLDAFTAETGIQTNVIYSNKGLAERMAAEGANSPADLLFTVDIGRLDSAKAIGVTQPVTNDTLADTIPAQYRDPEGHWFGLTTRSRIVYASKERVADTEITYEDLADPKWKGRVCTRSGQHVYTIGLIASIIAHSGEDAARTWLEGVRDNLARKPTGNDRAQVKAIFSGECDIALGNTYYMGAMLTNEKEPEQKDWANAVRILFPNASDRGSHVNISGIALARHAPNRDNAVRLMEFLSGATAQAMYAKVNFEYPVTAGVEIDPLVASWGELNADPLPLSDIAAHRARASELVDETAFDEGPSS